MSHTDWPAHLWIVRHGQSAGNVARDAAKAGGLPVIDIATRDIDVPLSPLGQAQSLALGGLVRGHGAGRGPRGAAVLPLHPRP